VFQRPSICCCVSSKYDARTLITHFRSGTYNVSTAAALIAAGAVVLALRNLGWAAADSDIATVGVALLSGVGFALLLVGVTTWLADRVPAPLRATAQALFLGTAYAIGTITGSLVAGWIAGVLGLQAMFYAVTVVAAVGAAITWLAVGRPGTVRG